MSSFSNRYFQYFNLRILRTKRDGVAAGVDHHYLAYWLMLRNNDRTVYSTLVRTAQRGM